MSQAVDPANHERQEREHPDRQQCEHDVHAANLRALRTCRDGPNASLTPNGATLTSLCRMTSLGAELQAWIDHLRSTALVSHHALHDHARAEREALDAPAPHEHQHDLT